MIELNGIQLDKTSAVPLYEQLRKALLEAITSGKLSAGTAGVAHTHKMVAAIPAFELEPCKKLRGIAYPLCTQHLGTVLQIQNPHLGGKAQLLVQKV